MGGGRKGAWFPLVAMVSAIQKILELLIVKDQQTRPLLQYFLNDFSFSENLKIFRQTWRVKKDFFLQWEPESYAIMPEDAIKT